MTKFYSKLDLNNTSTIIVDDPSAETINLIPKFLGFLFGFDINDSKLYVKFFDEIPSDRDIIEDFMRELNVFGYELKKEIENENAF